MLHLLPIRRVLTVVIGLGALMVLAAAYAGWVGTGDAMHDARRVIGWSSSAAIVLTVLSFAAWRWIPILQQLTFPYLGGRWSGELHFDGPHGVGTRAVTLTINHTPFQITLILDSAESTSRTLVVHAERDPGVNRDRLYYVFLNERKEGVAGAGERYRGLAVMRVEFADHPTLYGDYFTERHQSGKLQLSINYHHRWWMIWR
jgi:hypothetical protein